MLLNMVLAAPEFKQINDDLTRQFADTKKIAGKLITNNISSFRT